MLDDVFKRVQIRLEKVGLTAQAASVKAGLSKDAIRNLMRAAKAEDGREGVSTKTITSLAPVLKTSVEWLLTGMGASQDGEVRSVDAKMRLLRPDEYEDLYEDINAMIERRLERRTHKE